jgi:hypothetical protein
VRDSLPIIGSVRVNKKLKIPAGYCELKKNMLNEAGDNLYIGRGSAIIKLNATPEAFNLEIGDGADCEVTFFTLEMLIRFYIPKYGIIFMHTAGFILDNKVTVINAFGGVGKTEVMLGALEKGAQFIADDFAIFDEEGRVFPYTKRIYLCEYPYTEHMLRRVGKSRHLYNLKRFCEKRHDPISIRVSARLESSYFGIKIDYRDVTDKDTEFKYYSPDYFYWVDNSDQTGLSDVSSDCFSGKMKLCLDIESRRYFDYEGYLRLKYPFLNEYKSAQSAIIDSIAKKSAVRGLTIRNHHFDELISLVLKLNSK